LAKTAKNVTRLFQRFVLAERKQFLFQLYFICADSFSGGSQKHRKGSAAKIRPIADSLKDSTTTWLFNMNFV